MRVFLYLCLIAVELLCAQALAASAKVASCAPGKPPTTQTLRGMLTVHVVCDRVMFEIPHNMLDREILANTEFAALSSGSDFVAPGSAVDNRVIRLTRLGNKIYLEDVRYQMSAAKQSNVQRGVEAASLRTVIRAFDIIREGKDGAPIIDITGILVNEVPAGFALDLMRQFKMRAVDPRRSYIQTVKAYPENIDIRFYQTWVGTMKTAPLPWASSFTPACSSCRRNRCRAGFTTREWDTSVFPSTTTAPAPMAACDAPTYSATAWRKKTLRPQFQNPSNLSRFS
jgi:Domain of unknown function (DUF5117)